MADTVIRDRDFEVIEADNSFVELTEQQTALTIQEDSITIQVVEQPVQVVVPPDITVETTGDNSLEVLEVGVQGPQGIQGPLGPPGSGGGGGGSGIVGIGVMNTLTSLNLPAGGSIDLDGAVIDATTTGYLLAVDYSSSAACKWEIKTRSGGVDVLRVTKMTSGLTGGQPEGSWWSPDHNYVSQPGNGLSTTFRVTVTNLDARNAANVYATIFWDEV